MEHKIREVFSSPRIVAVTGDFNSGKSNLLKYILSVLNKNYKFSLYTYGLEEFDFGDTKICSQEELERIKNSIVVLDEFSSLLDLDNRKKKKLVERTLRLIFNQNNIIVFCGLPENFKKFISSKINTVFYTSSTLADFINGSKVKEIISNYKGAEIGSSVLSLNKNECIVYDGHYKKYGVPYLANCDTKKELPNILEEKDETPDLSNAEFYPIIEQKPKNYVYRKAL